jgi:hypothetical protein
MDACRLSAALLATSGDRHTDAEPIKNEIDMACHVRKGCRDRKA